MPGETTESQSGAITTCGTPQSISVNTDSGHTIMNVGSQRYLIPPTIHASNPGAPWPNNSLISAYLAFDGSVTCTYGATVPAALSADLPFLGCSNGSTAGMTLATTTLDLSGTLLGWSAFLTATLGKSIDDGFPCTVDRCINGLPDHPNAVDGTSCDVDSNLCNGVGRCSLGTCSMGNPPQPADPNDGNDCTSDACDPTKGIVNTGTCAPPASVPANSGTSVPTNVATIATLVAGTFSGALDLKRAAIIRGRIVDRGTGLKLPGVTVSVLNHPEFGTTTTRAADGYYDIAVNGGETYTLEFTFTGYVPVQRKAVTRWLDFTAMPDAAMVVFGASQLMTRDAPSAWQVFRGAPTTADTPYLTRTPRLFIPPMTHPTLPASGNYSVRATEFTVGALGAASMPGDLPAQSAYTYAVDLSIVGQTGTTPNIFNNTMYLYVEDFTGQPVSSDAPAPTGSYDRVTGTWKAETPGTIISFSVSGSVATLTSGVAPGMLAGELAMLGQEYGPTAPNQLFWRVPIKHFTSWDTNWNAGLAPNAVVPPSAAPQADTPSPRTTCNPGSVIECENQVLGESIPVGGTPFSLHYRSETQNGYHPTITVPLADATPPNKSVITTLDRAEVEIVVAGQRHVFPFTAQLLANQMMQWSWDRTDAYNNIVQGSVQAHVTVAYVYKPADTNYTANFGSFPSGVTFTGTTRANREIRLEKKYDLTIGGLDDKPLGLGGWTLSANHVMEPNTGTVWFGNGTKRVISDQPALVTNVVAGGGSPSDLAVAADGSVYAVAGGAVVKRSWNGSSFATWSGSASRTFTSGTTNINQILLNAGAVTIGPNGQIYIAEDCRILRVDPFSLPIGSNVTYLVAGVLSGGFCPPTPTPPVIDGTTAVTATLNALCMSSAHTCEGFTVTPDGSVYFAETNSVSGIGRLRRVRPDGTIDSVLGTGASSGTIPALCETSNTCRGLDQNINRVEALTYDSMGRLYFSVNGSNVVWRLDPDGIIRLVAGHSNNTNSTGDGGLAVDVNAGLDTVTGLSVRGASLYISENLHVRRVSPDGIITTVLGNGSLGFVNNAPATASGVHPVHALPGPDGYFYYVNNYSPSPGLFRFGVARDPAPGNTYVRSDDGSEVFEFDVTGKHIATHGRYHKGGSTGTKPLWSFAYDSAGRLMTITDGRATDTTRNKVTIAYSPTTNPTLVTISSFLGGTTARTTKLTLSGGYATKIEKPDLKFFSPVHTAAGLLTALTDENTKVHSFAYTGSGLLKSDINPLGVSAGTRLSRSVDKTSFTVAVATPENRVTTHRVDLAPTTSTPLRTEERTHTGPIDPLNLFTVDDHFSDGTRKVTFPQLAGQFNSVTDTATTDPRFGFGAAYLASSVVRAGLLKSHTVTRLRTTTMTNAADPFTVTNESEADTDTATGSTTMSSTEAFALTGSSVTTTSALGQTRKETLDTWDRVVKIEVLGNVPGLAQPLQPLNITYSATTGQLTGTSFGASARPVTIKYAATTGWVTGVNTPLGNVGYGLLDALGRPQKVTLPGARVVGLSYDNAGNVKTVTTPLGFIHTLTPNPVNLLATYAPPTASGPTGSTSYGYDNDSLLISLSKPGNSTVSYDRDSAGRPGTVAYPTATGYIDTLAYTYELDHVKTITSALGSALTYTYDGDMVTQEQTSFPGFNHSVYKTYDNFQRVTKREIDQQAAINFEYDADGLVSRMTGTGWGPYTITRPTGSPSVPANRMLSGTTLGGLTDTYEYDTFGALTKYQVKYNNSAVKYEVDYTRDPATGRVTSMYENIDGAACTMSYGYDPAGTNFLVSSSGTCPGSTANGYDADGNTPSAGATFDAQDRLTFDGYWTYGFDADGNVASQTSPSNDTYPFVTDAMGNLRRMTTYNFSLTTNYDFLIDGRNRRFGDQITYNGGAPTLLQGYVWDDNQIAGFHTASGLNGLKAHWAYGTKSHVPDLMVQYDSGTWNAYRVISDQLGSVKMVIDAVSGTVVEWRRYDAWGVPVATGGTQAAFSTVPFGFAGGLWNGNTGLYRFGARDYNPWKGRWWSKDPSRFEGGLNLYAYCANDPINCIDPSGLGFRDLLICLSQPGSSLADCIAWEIAKPTHIEPEGKMLSNSQPFRGDIEPPFPDFNACRSKALISEWSACCRFACKYHEDDPESCPGASMKPWNQRCYEKCVEPL